MSLLYLSHTYNTIYYYARCVGLEPLHHASDQGVISSTHGIVAYILTHPCRIGGYVDSTALSRRSFQLVVMPSRSFTNCFSCSGLMSTLAYISAVALCTNITSSTSFYSLAEPKVPDVDVPRPGLLAPLWPCNSSCPGR